jgi:hypothetical protein
MTRCAELQAFPSFEGKNSVPAIYVSFGGDLSQVCNLCMTGAQTRTNSNARSSPRVIWRERAASIRGIEVGLDYLATRENLGEKVDRLTRLLV